MRPPKIDTEIKNLEKPCHQKLHKIFMESGYLKLSTGGDVLVDEELLDCIENELFEAVSQKLTATST